MSTRLSYYTGLKFKFPERTMNSLSENVHEALILMFSGFPKANKELRNSKLLDLCEAYNDDTVFSSVS